MFGLEHADMDRLSLITCDNLVSAVAPLQKLHEVTKFQWWKAKWLESWWMEKGSSVSSARDAAAASRTTDGLHPTIRALTSTSCDVTRHSTSFICGENTGVGGRWQWRGGSIIFPVNATCAKHSSRIMYSRVTSGHARTSLLAWK